MKRIIAVIAVLAMLILASCSAQTDSESSTDTSSSVSSTSVESNVASDEPSEPVDALAHLRGIDYNGAEITFLVEGDYMARYKNAEVLPNDTNSDAMNSAIIERNRLVEELINIKIKEDRCSSSGQLISRVRASTQAGGDYDLVLQFTEDSAVLASEGNLYDLKNFSDIIKLDGAYWDQRANSDLSIGGKLFFTTGDFSVMDFDCMHAIIFNQDVASEVPGIDNFYSLVFDGKWTYDALLRNARLVTSETDGTDGMTFMDTWGFFVNRNYATTLFIGSGERLTSKDKNDLPVLSLNTARASSVVDKIIEIFNDKTASIYIEGYRNQLGGRYSDIWYAATAAFGEGRALFRAISLVDLNELEAYDCSYGILPTPKFSEDQEGYFDLVSGGECIGIPLCTPDAERSAAVAEAFAATSSETVRKAYYEIVLKGRRLKDEDGEKVLDIMLDNRVYELGAIFTWGNLADMINGIAVSGSNVFTSSIEASQDSIQAAIDKTINAFENIS